MLFRLIVLIIVAYIVVSAIRAHFAARRRGLGRSAAHGNGDEMVLDPQCQSYVPKREAIYQEGKYFCSRECANLFLSR